MIRESLREERSVGLRDGPRSEAKELKIQREKNATVTSTRIEDRNKQNRDEEGSAARADRSIALEAARYRPLRLRLVPLAGNSQLRECVWNSGENVPTGPRNSAIFVRCRNVIYVPLSG